MINVRIPVIWSKKISSILTSYFEPILNMGYSLNIVAHDDMKNATYVIEILPFV